VACTRAMFELHVMAEEVKEYSLFSSLSAKCYADFTDISRYHPQYVSTNEQDEQQFDDVVLVGRPDENLLEAINAHFQRPYTYRRSIDLPVKSSASAILRMQEQEVGNAKVLFKEEREKSFSGTDVGTAYHRFLELCDLSVSDEKAITAQRLQMEKDGLLSPEQSNILSDKKLVEILSMPIFRKVKGAQIYREQEFLCRIPARDFLPTPAEDVVLVQGAIDLLILGKDGCHIVDYKYSARTDEGLREAYAGQLALYKKAVSIILKIDEKTIKTTIVNIRLNREIVLD
jgi:ATP-dependent exoDNAse (exonuclease V) beta subunit